MIDEKKCYRPSTSGEKRRRHCEPLCVDRTMQDKQSQLNGFLSSYQSPALVCEDVLVDNVLRWGIEEKSR